jgi:hypothetical protein
MIAGWKEAVRIKLPARSAILLPTFFRPNDLKTLGKAQSGCAGALGVWCSSTAGHDTYTLWLSTARHSITAVSC